MLVPDSLSKGIFFRRTRPRPRTLAVLAASAMLSGAPAAQTTPHDDADSYWTRERKAVALNIGIVAGVAAYGFAHWDWGQGDARFEARSEGWFGKDTRHGGADKLGHMYTGAVSTALGAALYRRWGYDEAQAARLGAATGLLLTTAVEIGDGFSPQHKFSWEDQVSNMVGVGFEYLRLRYPALRERVHFRWEYFPSESLRRGDNYDFITDYSGQRWVLAFPLRAWGHANSPLRWIELQAGYGTRGYGRRDEPYFDRARRHPFVGIGINIPLVLESFGASPGVQRVFEHVQIPGTALPLPP